MTAQILPFAACPNSKAITAQPHQPCRVISFAECREKRRRRLETSNVLVRYLDDMSVFSRTGA